MRLREERDHLFQLHDFLDYCAAADTHPPPLSALLETLPEGVVHHYSIVGDVLDLTILTADSTQFAISGFSIVRHGATAYWYVLGGEMLTDEEWEKRGKEDDYLNACEAPEKSALF